MKFFLFLDTEVGLQVSRADYLILCLADITGLSLSLDIDSKSEIVETSEKNNKATLPLSSVGLDLDCSGKSCTRGIILRSKTLQNVLE